MTVLAVRDLVLEFGSRDAAGRERVARVLDGVDLDVGDGRIVGLIGETGAGKSMTATATIGLLPAGALVRSGEIRFEGVDMLGLSELELDRFRGARIGFVSQNPRAALEPVTRVGDQIVRLIRAHASIDAAGARARALEILEAVGIPDPQARLRAWPHELSGGMAQRVVIAMALVNRPALVIADEPTTGLDLTVQAQVLDLLQSLVRSRGAAALVITHDLGIVAQYCDDIAVMFAGRVIERGRAARVFAEPQHPYTRRLIAASRTRLAGIDTRLSADPPDPFTHSTGCVYADRCAFVAAECASAPPETVHDRDDRTHRVRCHRVLAVRAAP